MVAPHHGRAADDDLALLVRRRRASRRRGGSRRARSGFVRPDGALAVEHARAARHQHAVGRLGLPVRLDDLRAVEEVGQRPLRRHRRRRAADAHLAHRAPDARGHLPLRHDVEHHAADERQVGDAEALRRLERPRRRRTSRAAPRARRASTRQSRCETRTGTWVSGLRQSADAVGLVAARLRAREDRPEQVLVRQDHALRRAGRAGRVRDGGDRLRRRRARRRGAGAAAAGAGAGPAAGRRSTTSAAAPAAARRLARDLGARGVGHQEPGLRVREQPRRLVRRRARRDRHRDGAEPPAAHRARPRPPARSPAITPTGGPAPDPVTDEPALQLVDRRRQLAERDGATAEHEPAVARRGAPPAVGGTPARSAEEDRRAAGAGTGTFGMALSRNERAFL